MSKVLHGRLILKHHESILSLLYCQYPRIINYKSEELCLFILQNYGDLGNRETGKLWDISAFTKVTMGYVDTEDFICNLWTIRHLGQHFKRISHYEKYLKHQKKEFWHFSVIQKLISNLLLKVPGI